MARSPLTETINRVQGMMSYVRENLSTDEYMLFLDLLAPEPEPIVPQKASKKKRQRNSGGKSVRATEMAETIKKRAKPDEPRCVACYEINDHPNHGVGDGQHQFSTDLTGRVLGQLGHDGPRCAYSANGKTCNGAEGDAIHDSAMGYSGYHEFVGAETVAAAGGE